MASRQEWCDRWAPKPYCARGTPPVCAVPDTPAAGDWAAVEACPMSDPRQATEVEGPTLEKVHQACRQRRRTIRHLRASLELSAANGLLERQEGLHMPNDHIPPEHPRREADLVSAESGRNEAERFRRLAEEAREVRDQHREALETVRQERERLREAGEIARVAGEEARAAAEGARQATLDAVHATAEALASTLEGMKLVEDMRRTLRDIRDVTRRESN